MKEEAKVEVRSDDPEVQHVEVPKKLPAPDGGWGWMVVLGCAVNQVIFGTIVRAFGVIYLALLERYGASATATAWVGAINFAGTGFLGPLASLLCRKYTFRQVTIAGGLLVAAGTIATGFAPNIFVTYVTFGFITGAGLSLSIFPAYIIVGQYFDKRKALAMAVASFSSGIGALISPPILLILFKEYGFMGMFLLVGGYSLNICVAGGLYRPLSVHLGLMNSKKSEKKDVYQKTSSITESTKDYQKEAEVTDTFIKKEPHPISDNDEVYIKDQTTQPLSVTKPTKDEEEKEEKAKTLKERYAKLFKSPPFLAFTFLVFSVCYTLGLVSGFLPALAIENHVSETKAAFLLSIGGICSMVSTLAIAPVLDLPSVRRHRVDICSAVNAILGISTILQGVVSNYIAYVILVAFNSGAGGPLIAQRATIVVDIVGSASDAEGFGVVMMACSVGSLLGRSLAGTIKDLSGQYNSAFFLAGCICLFSCFIFEFTLIRQRILTNRKKLQGLKQ